VDTDHRGELVCVRCGDLGIAQLACPPGLADPPSGRTRLAGGIGDVNIAAKPDDIAKAQIIEELEQLVVAEAAVREDRDGTTRRHKFL